MLKNNDQDDISNDTHKQGNINGINSLQIKKYRQKFKDDDYATNCNSNDIILITSLYTPLKSLAPSPCNFTENNLWPLFDK